MKIRSNGERWNHPVRKRKLAISIANQHTVPGAWAPTAVSRFDVVIQLFRLLLLHRQSAKINALLLKMPHTTACVFVAVVRILHINSDIIQLGVPDLLVYAVSSNITFRSKGMLWYDLHVIGLTAFLLWYDLHVIGLTAFLLWYDLHVIGLTAFREYNLLCLPIDSLWWQFVEWQCQGCNIRMHLCVNWCKIRKFTFCIVNFDTELEQRIFRMPTVSSKKSFPQLAVLKILWHGKATPDFQQLNLAYL